MEMIWKIISVFLQDEGGIKKSIPDDQILRIVGKLFGGGDRLTDLNVMEMI